MSRGFRLGSLAWLVALAVALAPAPACADEATELQRAKFEEGMAQFQEGHFQQAIDRWEPIVQDRGDAKAYRVLYNLGLAYDELGRTTRAADRLNRFLAEVARRSAADVPAEVRDFEAEARRRLAKLDAAYGRIRLVVEGGERVAFQLDREDRSAEVDLVFYLVPGVHVLTLRPGQREEETRTLDIAAGRLLEVPVRATPPAVSYVVAPPPPVPVIARAPFSPAWIGIAAGATVASVVLPVYLRGTATDTKRQYDDPATSPAARRELDHQYGVERARYEVSWLLPAGLAAGTTALALVYVFAPREKVPVSVEIGGGPRSPSVSVGGSF